MTFEDDVVLQHLIKYPQDPDTTIHSLAVERELSLSEAKNTLKRKAKNYFSKKDYFRYFDGDVEVDEWVFASGTTRLAQARAYVATEYPLSGATDCNTIENYLYSINEDSVLAVERQAGKARERKYNEVLEKELARRKKEFQEIRRGMKCLDVDSVLQEAKDTSFISDIGSQTGDIKRGTESGNTFLYLMIGVGIVGLALVAGFSTRKK